MKRFYAWLAFAATLLALLILLAFQAIWVAFGSPAGLMTQVGLQRAREQHMVKDVLVLEDRYDPGERSDALSELQDTLPLWEQVQQGLQHGNASLGLPRHPPDSVLLVLTQTQSDYAPMDVAFKKILASSAHPDPAQIQIVLDHERSYFVSMSNVVTLWQQRIDEAFLQLFWIEAGLTAAIAVVVVVNFVFMMRSLRNKGGA